jgi:hypothetical protein
MDKRQVIDYQTVKKDMYEEFSCILLRSNELSKEELLLSGLMRLCDDEGCIKLWREFRTSICASLEISESQFNNAMSRFRKLKILYSSGEYVKFSDKFMIGKENKFIFIR